MKVRPAPLLRRFLVLAVLLLLMQGAKALSLEESGSKPLVLAAIGFVILASFSVAETFSTLGLPRVTGYIVTGAVLYQTRILSGGVADELQMFNTLALGLIALSAGLELSLPELKQLSRTLLTTTAAKLALAVPLVGGAAYGYITFAPRLGLPAPELSSPSAAVALSIVLGALALGTSPAIALAVISESKSKGRVGDLVLGAAVLKDMVVVIVLAVAIAISSGLLGDGRMDASSLGHVAVEVGYSLLAGLALGGLLIAYIRYVNAEMLMFVGAMVLAVAEVAKRLHLELLLVFIVGGLVVRNFSKYEHDLGRPVHLASLPIFVVFFTIAGAHIDLQTTLLLLPFALVLSAARAVGFHWAAKIGNRVGDESPVVRQNVWLGYLPQAGVTLGLLGLATEKLPQLQAALRPSGMAFIAVNLLLGPVALRLALRRAGETHDQAEPELLDERAEAAPSQRLPAEVAGPLERVVARLDSEVLAAHLAANRRWAERTEAYCLALAQSLLVSRRVSGDQWRELRQELETLDGDEAQRLFIDGRAVVRFLPETVRTALRPQDLLVQPNDAPRVRGRKRRANLLRRLTFQKPRPRQIPLLALARESFEPRLAELSTRSWASKFRLAAALLEDLTTLTRLGTPAEETAARIRVRVEEWLDDLTADFQRLCRLSVDALSPIVEKIDTAYLPSSKRLPIDTDDQVRRAFVIYGASTAWLEALDADWNRLVSIHQMADLRTQATERTRALLSEEPKLRLTRLLAHLGAWTEEACALGKQCTAEDFVDQCQLHQAVIQEAPRTLVESTTAELRQALNLRPLSLWLEQELAAFPAEVQLTTPAVSPSGAQSPVELTYRTVELRRIAEGILLKSTLTTLETNAQVFENEFRSICAELLRTQDDFRLALRSANLESARSREHLAAATVTLEDTYRRCQQAIQDQLTQLAEVETRTIGEAFSNLDTTILLETGLRSPQTRKEYWTAQVRLLRVRAERRVSSVMTRVHTWWQESGERLFGGVMQELSARKSPRQPDAQTIRATMAALDSPAEAEYAELFRLEAVRDPSRFVAHEAVLAQLIAAEDSWLRGGLGSALVLGERGSGKTSLLNMLHYRTAAPRVIRLEPLAWRRKVGILRALAYSLDCSPQPHELALALSDRPTHVIIDDLEHWVPPGPAGLEDLTRVLNLASTSRAGAFWTVAVGRDYFEIASAVIDLRSAFGCTLELGALTRSELRAVLEARHAESGRPLELPRTISSWLRWDGFSPGDQEVVYELIRRTTAGNLSRALLLWTLLTRVDDEGCVRLHASRAPLSVSLPFLRYLPVEQLALLSLLNRLGPLTFSELTEQLCLDASQLERLVAFLTSGGLLDQQASGLISIHPKCSALASLGLKGLAAG